MVKLGNAAPERMCEAVRSRLQGEDSWFTPYKIKLQLGKEQLGSLYKAMEDGQGDDWKLLLGEWK